MLLKGRIHEVRLAPVGWISLQRARIAFLGALWYNEAERRWFDMIEKDFSNVTLTKSELRFLKKLKHKTRRYTDKYEKLKAKGYVDYASNYVDENRMLQHKTDEIKLTEIGMAFLSYRRKKFIKDYLFDIINLTIALAALITAVISILLQQ